LPYAKPGAVKADWARGIIFSPAQYEYHEGVNTLPLYVLVDTAIVGHLGTTQLAALAIAATVLSTAF